MRSYTSEQIKFIKALKAKGFVWSFIATKFEERYKVKVSGDAMRFAVARKRKKVGNAPVVADKNNKVILCISDLHAPYMHQDTVKFLAAVKKKYNPTRVVCLGDERDGHAESYHESSPDLPSAGDELDMAVEQLKPIYKLFPVADVLESNHGSLAVRKAQTAGISRKHLQPYRDVLGAPKGWDWHMDLLLDIPNGSKVYFHHGLCADVMKLVSLRGVCCVQGHYHNTFKIGYIGNPQALLWGMQVGCSIDAKSMAFAYGRNTLQRPVVGHGIIIDGLPKLLPMVLNSNGRWNGIVP
jgi:hypothetical protein